MSRSVVYTAIIGPGLQLNDPKVVSDEWDYVCFTNRTDLQSEVWDIRREITPDFCGACSRKYSRRAKILNDVFLPEYDQSIWIDAGYRLRVTPEHIMEKYELDLCRMAIMENRRSVYEELAACIAEKKGNNDDMLRQVRRYQEEELPDSVKTAYCGFIYRRHRDADVAKLMNIWWEELCRGSERDQISYGYAIWKHPVPVKLLHRTNLQVDCFGLKRKMSTHNGRNMRKHWNDDMRNLIEEGVGVA